MKYILSLFSTLVVLSALAHPPKQEYYELRTYQLSSEAQETRLHTYLKDALVPALHRAGIGTVGVFRLKGNDTAAIRKVMLLIPYKSLSDLDALDSKLEKDKTYNDAGADYINAAHDNPAYTRFSKVIMKAFSGHPVLSKPAFTNPRNERVYELRSYEAATEKLYRKKVDMFVGGKEIAVFNRLKFNAVFYGEVLAGTAMPNLVYMISFDNLQSRDAVWKSFIEDPEWKVLSGDKQYANTVSHIDSYYLEPTEYSDF